MVGRDRLEGMKLQLHTRGTLRRSNLYKIEIASYLPMTDMCDTRFCE